MLFLKRLIILGKKKDAFGCTLLRAADYVMAKAVEFIHPYGDVLLFLQKKKSRIF